MLMKLMKLIRESGGYADLDGLSEKLGVDRPTLDGMIETLKREGRLLMIPASGNSCSGKCSGCKTCH